MTRLLILLLAGCSHHIPDPHLASPIPDAATPASDLTVCWLEYDQGKLPKGPSVAHHALHEDLVSTASGLLLISPKGSWLIDGGLGANYHQDMAEVHGFFGFAMHQAAKGWTVLQTPAQALASVGVDPATLTGLIPTHGHFDHIGGLLDLPNTPIVLPQAEIDMAKAVIAGTESHMLPAEARALLPRAKPLEFTGGPFLMWDRSDDLFGDGSAVLVPMPGHTPGSVGIRVLLPDGRALMLVGDTVWVREGYEQREPKGFPAGAFDSDRASTDDQIGRLWTLHKADPKLAILPAHDRRAWVDFFGKPGCVKAGT